MSTSRRSFLHAAAAAAAAQALQRTLAAGRLPQGQGGDELRIGLIGCGGRGTGALAQALTAKGPSRVVAVADMFEERLDKCLEELADNAALRERIDVPQQRRFVGPDAYLGVIGSDCDVVLIATPPHFRPAHFEAAIAANKHVFFEKPVAVDPPGVRRVLAASAAAKRAGLAVCSGLQRHHQHGYVETMRRVHGGDLGRILFARASWNQGSLWCVERKPEWTDMEWQLRNWLYFTWLSGDHIVEQHVHNLDVVNWALQAHPVRCRGMGGRQVRTHPRYGHVFDHHAVQYQYANGAWCFSECRQIDGCVNDVSEHLYGTLGEAHLDPSRWTITGERAWKYDGVNNDPYQTEHDDFFASIRAGKPLQEGDYVAESTLTAIMGRMATYSGREVTWDEALNSDERWGPASYAPGPLPVDPVAMPGQKRG